MWLLSGRLASEAVTRWPGRCAKVADDFDLDDDERELIRKRREERSRDNFTVRIRQGDNEGELPYGKARAWFQRTFGIDLDDEPAQDEDGGEKPKRFTAGRRTG